MHLALPSTYLVHQEIIAGLTDRDPKKVEEAIARHREIILAIVDEQIKADESRKEMVQQIKKNPPR